MKNNESANAAAGRESLLNGNGLSDRQDPTHSESRNDDSFAPPIPQPEAVYANRYIKDGKVTGSFSEERMRKERFLPILLFVLSIPLLTFGIAFRDWRLVALGSSLLAIFLSHTIYRHFYFKKLRSGYIRYMIAEALEKELEIVGRYKYNSYFIDVLFRAADGKLCRGRSHNAFTFREATGIISEECLLIAYLPGEDEEILIL